MEHEECAEGPHYVTEKLKNLEVDGSVVRHNPNDHYAEELPEREVSQTDHLNAKLLSAFDKLLSQGAFKIPVSEEVSDWPEEEN